jgi:hypothetical protein
MPQWGQINVEAWEPPEPTPYYELKYCKRCHEYDFAGDFRYCFYKDPDSIGSALIQGAPDIPGFHVCHTCCEKAYLSKDESEGAYQARMAMRKVRKKEE